MKVALSPITPDEDFTEPESSDEDMKLVHVLEKIGWRYYCDGLCRDAGEVVWVTSCIRFAKGSRVSLCYVLGQPEPEILSDVIFGGTPGAAMMKVGARAARRKVERMLVEYSGRKSE